MNLHTLLATALIGLAAGFGSLAPAAELIASPAQDVQRLVPVEALNPDVHQDTINKTICVPGYTASVRPSTTYTNGVKLKVLREHGLPASAAKDYELDHRIPLALGGHPRNLHNLMLQPWEGPDGAKAKDRLERRLQRLVCTRKLPLDEARHAIYVDWQAAYRKYVGLAR